MQTIKVPNLMNMMKSFELKLNPNYEDYLKVSDKFIKKYGGKYTKQFLEEDRPLFYALTCPTASVENLLLVTDLYDFLWFYDELTDENPKLGHEYGKVLLEIVDNQDVEVNFLMAEAAKDVFKRLKSLSSPSDCKTLCDYVKILIASQMRETKRREKNEILSVEAYMKERLETSGVEANLLSCIIAEEISIPKRLLESENYKFFKEAYVGAFWVSNDIYSFYREHRRNAHDSNLITVLTKEKKISHQAAFDEAGKLFQNYIDSFIERKQKLMNEFTDDEEIRNVLKFFDINLRGFVEWHVVSRRYIGSIEKFKENHVIKI